MGYNVRIVKSDVIIPTVHLDRVFQIFTFINLPEFDELKRGGGGYGNQRTYWYSWMNEQESCQNAAEVIQELGFDIIESDAGIAIIGYDSKTGQEDLFLGVIGHLITGSIIWVGEDGETWTDVYPSYNNKFHNMIRDIMLDRKMIDDNFG